MNNLLNRISNPSNFTPSDIPSTTLTDGVVIVTGGNAGLGYATILQLVKYTCVSKVYMACRSRTKYETAMSKLDDDLGSTTPKTKVEYLELDVSSLKSVQSAAETFLSANSRLDILLNNAGIMGAAPTLSPDGYEIHFATNHLGHALLTRLLLPTLLSTRGRILNTSSIAHMGAPGRGIVGADTIDTPTLRTPMANYTIFTRYGQSKRAQILFTHTLATLHPSVTSLAIHPGRVSTGILDGLYARPSSMFDRLYGYFQRGYDTLIGALDVDHAAQGLVWACVVPREEVKNGAFYTPIGTEEADDRFDPEMARQLWEWEEEQFEESGVGKTHA